ncbi:AAA domain-containing protein [Daedaleopsis nitida]|nr:AAA domain-containing protein [Daedaleopsis nitida]
MLVLVGLIGSGKSTFAEALERHFPQFRRCSQDDLGDRRSVEALARTSLRDGLSVCIDRTNFDERSVHTDPVQLDWQAHWIDIAHERPGTQVWVVVFDTPYEVCAARVAARTNHPTITNPEQGLQVLQRFRSQYREPLPHEGYKRILRVTPSDFPDIVVGADVVRDIMRRLQESPEVTSTMPPAIFNQGSDNDADQHRGYRGQRGASSQRGWQPRGGYGLRGGPVRGGYGGAGPELSQSTLPWGRGGGGGGSQWQPYPTRRAYNSDIRGRLQSQSDNDRTQESWRRAGPS